MRDSKCTRSAVVLWAVGGMCIARAPRVRTPIRIACGLGAPSPCTSHAHNNALVPIRRYPWVSGAVVWASLGGGAMPSRGAPVPSPYGGGGGGLCHTGPHAEGREEGRCVAVGGRGCEREHVAYLCSRRGQCLCCVPAKECAAPWHSPGTCPHGSMQPHGLWPGRAPWGGDEGDRRVPPPLAISPLLSGRSPPPLWGGGGLHHKTVP